MERDRDSPLASVTGSQLMNMPAPPGHVRLNEAVDILARRLIGSSWQRATDPRQWEIAVRTDADTDRVIRTIAEQCEAGMIEAAYRSALRGADPLDRAVWRMPHWRNYFVTSTIDLDLPWIDGNRELPPDGRPLPRCTREIFIRRDSLDQFVGSLAPAAKPAHRFRYPGDAALVSRGVEMVKNGTAALRAAKILAKETTDGDPDQRIERLRKLIKDAAKA